MAGADHNDQVCRRPGTATGNTIIHNAPTQNTAAEEKIHAGSHGAGLLLSIAELVWMLNLSFGAADAWRIVASGIYGFSLICLFLTSTLYHGLHDSPHRDLFKLLDHCAIYMLIAGSAMPILLVTLRSDTSWWLFGAMWAMAVAGILGKVRYRHAYPRLSLASYLVMGWLMAIAMPELSKVIGANGVAWLVAGGLSYSVGAVFYTRTKMLLHHTIWHLFVLAGATCHFLVVVWYVLPLS